MKKILFVCIENSCRSQMAEGFARIYGAAGVEAYSAGSRPSGVVNSRAIAFMAEIGYDLSTHHSKPLDELKDIQFDYVITMGCGDECPWIVANHREDWGITDPKNLSDKEFCVIRDEIGRKVNELLHKLS